jgi:hypothetical protein
MNRRAIRLTSKTRTQTEIEIRRRSDGAQTPDDLSQLSLPVMKLPARSTLSQVFHCSRAARVIKHQLIELSTNYFAIVLSHNFFTYK